MVQEKRGLTMGREDGIYFEYRKIKCPICGKEFHPELDHAWKIGEGKYSSKIVCTYTCMRKWEKANKIKRRGD